MKRFFSAHPVSTAVLAATLALTSAFATGAGLRREASKTSHQQTAEDRWFVTRPVVSRELAERGRALFLDSCAHCHGADARGDEGPDLHDVQVSDRYIRTVVTRGIPHEMPSFQKKLGAGDITALTAYIRTLE
jgi:mono/diheme cytochrome c family protein